MSADQRREAVLQAAMIEFGLSGYNGASTEAIARRVGVSQPYLFRLFPSKKAIFMASVERCFDRVQSLFEQSAEGLTGEAAFQAMGAAYNGLLDDREVLQMQLQVWASACHDEDVRDATRRRMGGLFATAQRATGGDDERVTEFLSRGMLLNVMAAMDIARIKHHMSEGLAALAATVTAQTTGGSAKPAGKAATPAGDAVEPAGDAVEPDKPAGAGAEPAKTAGESGA